MTNWHQFKSLKHSTTLPYAFTEHGVAMLKTIFDAIRQLMTVEEKPKRRIGFRPD